MTTLDQLSPTNTFEMGMLEWARRIEAAGSGVAVHTAGPAADVTSPQISELAGIVARLKDQLEGLEQRPANIIVASSEAPATRDVSTDIAALRADLHRLADRVDMAQAALTDFISQVRQGAT